jgi:hypothetical protein
MTQSAQEVIKKWELGDTSKLYESGLGGVAIISSGKGDKGGVSYGAYQLSSKEGTLNEYLNNPAYGNYGKQFIGLSPGSKDFNLKWVAIAKTDSNFAITQHKFIEDTHYDPFLKGLDALGINLSNRGLAIQDMLWSTSVQFRGIAP